MSEPTGAPIPDPRADRFRPLVIGSKVAMVAATGLALLSMAVPPEAERWIAGAAIVVVLVAPVARILWLANRWFRRGDPRYGWVAIGVLAVVAAAAGAAAL